MVRGFLMQHVMEAVSQDSFGGAGSQRLMDDALRDLNQSDLKPADQTALRSMLEGVK
jgi:hypothetical protein